MQKVSVIILILTITSRLFSQPNYNGLNLEILTIHDYVCFPTPIEYYYDGQGWGDTYHSVLGKYCFGAGLRINYYSKSRLTPYLIMVLLDKGYRLHYYGETDTGPFNAIGKYRPIYFSIPIGVAVNLSRKSNPYYLISGISTDILVLNSYYGLNRIGASITVGVGRRFDIARLFKLSIEPNLKISITKYGDLLIKLNEFDPYIPYSFGIQFGISL